MMSDGGRVFALSHIFPVRASNPFSCIAESIFMLTDSSISMNASLNASEFFVRSRSVEGEPESCMNFCDRRYPVIACSGVIFKVPSNKTIKKKTSYSTIYNPAATVTYAPVSVPIIISNQSYGRISSLDGRSYLRLCNSSLMTKGAARPPKPPSSTGTFSRRLLSQPS
jgi:hypothetical protein